MFGEARAMPQAVAAPPVPCGQRRTAFTASRVSRPAEPGALAALDPAAAEENANGNGATDENVRVASKCTTHATANGRTDQVASAGGAG